MQLAWMEMSSPVIPGLGDTSSRSRLWANAMERDDPIKVCRLYEKLSKNGNQYFTGRWGSAKVLLLKF